MEALQKVVFDQIDIWATRLGMALIVVVLFWLLMKILRKAIYSVAVRLELDDHLIQFLLRITRLTLIVIAVVTILGTLGVNVSALVAGVGMTGLALGFALKDTISNLLAGILILLYRPFKVGDYIKISGYEGKVASIDLRYTILSEDRVKVLVPNEKFFTDPITVIG